MEEGKHAGNLIYYLKSKLSGKNPDKAEDMKKFSQKSKKSPNSFVTLTTAHRAKGLQWERVFIIQPNVFNPEGDKIRTEEEAQQEKNALYVAFSRPEKILIVSNDDEPKSGSSNDEDAGDMDNMVKMMLKM
jgi:superfamily I DNA/RNA helicase